jgi:hypothetical protein
VRRTGLIIFSSVLLFSSAYADKVVIHYTDGTVQTLKLKKPYERIEVLKDAPPQVRPRQSFVDVEFTAINRGQDADLKYHSSDKLTGTAWLGVIPADVPHGDGYENDKYDVVYVYLKGKASGSLEIHIPTNIPQGEYEIRIFDSDSNGREIASSPPFYIY